MEGQEDGVTREDWFFCTKEVTEEEVYAAIGKQPAGALLIVPCSVGICARLLGSW